MRRCVAATALLGVAASGHAQEADDDVRIGYSDKLVLTGGVSQLEGSAGGGLTPWAVIAGQGTRDQVGAVAWRTRVNLDDYHLDAGGVAVGIHDRLELSLARQEFDTERVGAALGLGRGYTLRQDVFGAKLRLAGDAVLEQDTWQPQLSVGVQFKRNHASAVLRAIGAKDDHGVDVYLSATKLFLGQSFLLNATLRATRANQMGVLGYGGDRNSGYRVEPEFSGAFLLRRDLAVGAEYRFKPDNLRIAHEDDWWDAFVAWMPSKHVSFTLAYARLGNVVIKDRQDGWYLSAQVGF